jgi:hypothetical protein
MFSNFLLQSHDKSGGLWSLDSAQQHQNQGNGGNLSSHISPSTNTGTQGLTSDEMNAVNSSNVSPLTVF